MTVTAPPPTGTAARSLEHEALEALIEEARLRARRRRRRSVVILLAALVAGGSLYLLLAGGVGRPRTASHFMRVAVLGPERFRPGQFWYTRTISWQRDSLPAGGIVQRRARYRPVGPSVEFEYRVSEETWMGLDGTLRDRAVASGAHFVSALGRRQWAAYGRPIPNFNHVWLGWMSHDGITGGGARFPVSIWASLWGESPGPGGGWDVGDGLFTYRQLLSLPTGPAALRARFAAAKRALARRAHFELPGQIGAETASGNDTTGLSPQPGTLGELSDIGSLLMAPLPASLRLALFHVALTLPFVRIDRHAHDALGRPGVAVSVSRGHGRIVPFFELIFDPATGALLGEAPHVAVVAHSVVDSLYALPKGIKPIHPAGAPAAPLRTSISPSVGTSTTDFRVTLSSPERGEPRRPPALSWALIGTPSDSCFGGFVAHEPGMIASAGQTRPLIAASSHRQAGMVSYVYNLTPLRLNHSSWCRGRYELNVLPKPSKSARGLLEGGSPNLIPGVGTSAFFQVR